MEKNELIVNLETPGDISSDMDNSLDRNRIIVQLPGEYLTVPGVEILLLCGTPRLIQVTLNHSEHIQVTATVIQKYKAVIKFPATK